MGGDEFLIVFDGLNAEGAEKVWSRIAGQLAELDSSGRYRFRLSVSHGIASFETGISVDTLIEQADDRMYA